MVVSAHQVPPGKYKVQYCFHNLSQSKHPISDSMTWARFAVCAVSSPLKLCTVQIVCKCVQICGRCIVSAVCALCALCAVSDPLRSAGLRQCSTALPANIICHQTEVGSGRTMAAK